jgi:hypothetical protein
LTSDDDCRRRTYGRFVNQEEAISMNLTSPRTGGVLLVAAAPTLLAAELIRSDHSQERYAAQLADVSAHRAPELVSAILFLVGGVLLVLAAIGLSRISTAGRGGRLVQVGSALIAVGGLWMVAGRGMFEAIIYALAAADTATSARALDQIGNSAGTAIFIPFLLALLAAPIVLSLGLGRMGITSRWLSAVWFAGLLVFLATETSKLGNLVGFGTMMGVLTAIGLAVAATADRGVAYAGGGMTPS